MTQSICKYEFRLHSLKNKLIRGGLSVTFKLNQIYNEIIFLSDRVDICVQCQSTETNSDCVFPDNLNGLTQTCTNSSGSCFSRIIGKISIKIKFYAN